jgi:hypothetical protein
MRARRLGLRPRGGRPVRELTPLDFTILTFLSESPRPVRELVEAQPRGSVYRRLKRLQVMAGSSSGATATP